MSARMTLRRADGRVYLDRWGFEWKALGGIFLHHMTAPDPGYDLHNHPWSFLSLVLKGGYSEDYSENHSVRLQRWKPWSIHFFPRRGRHRVVSLRDGKSSWSIIIHGPNTREWGFFVDGQWLPARVYEGTSRGKSRGLEWKTSRADARASARKKKSSVTP